MTTPRHWLAEHCDAPGCVNGYKSDGSHCGECAGTTRRIRHRFDARSAIDYDDVHPFERAYGAWSNVTAERVRELVRQHANDGDLGSAVRALMTEGE